MVAMSFARSLTLRGIVFEGVAYHLLGRAAMDELETVSLEQTDAGSEITKATEAGGIVFVTLAEAGSIDAETAAEHADLFAEWAFPVGYDGGQIRRYNGTLYKCVHGPYFPSGLDTGHGFQPVEQNE